MSVPLWVSLAGLLGAVSLSSMLTRDYGWAIVYALCSLYFGIAAVGAP